MFLILRDSVEHAKTTNLSFLMPVTSSITLGIGTGLFKKISLSEIKASQRFPTAFIFFVTFAMVVISPIFKFPSLAARVREIAD